MLLGIVVVIRATHVSDSARTRYAELVASQPRKARKDKLKNKQEVTKQTRWDVQKSVWLTEGTLRRTLEIEAKRSEMALFASKHKMHFMETFYNATGIVQQELYYKDRDGKEYVFGKEGVLKQRESGLLLDSSVDLQQLTPMQCFRYFEAKQAVCDFDSESIVAIDVQFWTYAIEGHELCRNYHALTPIAVGKASSMTLAEKNEEREFYAENLRLQIKNGRGVW